MATVSTSAAMVAVPSSATSRSAGLKWGPIRVSLRIAASTFSRKSVVCDIAGNGFQNKEEWRTLL